MKIRTANDLRGTARVYLGDEPEPRFGFINDEGTEGDPLLATWDDHGNVVSTVSFADERLLLAAIGHALVYAHDDGDGHDGQLLIDPVLRIAIKKVYPLALALAALHPNMDPGNYDDYLSWCIANDLDEGDEAANWQRWLDAGQPNAYANDDEDDDDEDEPDGPPDNLCGLCGLRVAEPGMTACSTCA